MKKLLLIAAVAMTAFFTSCTKDEPASVNLAEQLCSMFNQPVEQALETAKSLGYTLIAKGKVDEYICYKDTSTATGKQNRIDLMYNDKNENRVVNVACIISGTSSDIVSQAKSLTEQTGESRVVNNVTTAFSEGAVDGEKNIESYSQFLEKVGNAKSNAVGSWVGPAPSYAPIIAMVVEAQEQQALVMYTVSIGG